MEEKANSELIQDLRLIQLGLMRLGYYGTVWDPTWLYKCKKQSLDLCREALQALDRVRERLGVSDDEYVQELLRTSTRFDYVSKASTDAPRL